MYEHDKQTLGGSWERVDRSCDNAVMTGYRDPKSGANSEMRADRANHHSSSDWPVA
jgi:hypothetical protein